MEGAVAYVLEDPGPVGVLTADSRRGPGAASAASNCISDSRSPGLNHRRVGEGPGRGERKPGGAVPALSDPCWTDLTSSEKLKIARWRAPGKSTT